MTLLSSRFQANEKGGPDTDKHEGKLVSLDKAQDRLWILKFCLFTQLIEGSKHVKIIRQ